MTPSLVKHIDSLQWLRSLPGKPLVVAEIKPRSPFSGWTNPYSISDQLAICEAVGDIVSVHTDEMWGGSWRLLESIHHETDKDILAKGFHPTIHHVKRALEFAEWCLTVGWDGGERCWHEVESVEELLETNAARVVWNRRCPRTGAKRTPRPSKVRTLYDGWLCQASHIAAPQDVVPGMQAILIGEGLYH